MKNILTTAVLLFVIVLGANAQITGNEIVEKAYNLPSGEDQSSVLKMTLQNKQGSQRVRVIKQFNKDFGKVEKKIMFFQSPADIKNTSFMNWSYSTDKNDDQWIYLPALKRTKRISSDSKSDYFMGSDFTYDDLGDRKLSADTHKLLKEETVNNVDCYVVESTSKDVEYMYSKTITWINKETFVGVKKEFYDEDEDLLKVLSIKKVEKIADFFIITNSEMKNVQNGHSTLIELSDVEINTSISSSKFTERMMMRGM
ncbi:MAG: outer membrane lipoprotein-sorting protein [Ichthyobacteriaceae bacterium]|nr:outer membrane lipoprotein-sorting protein [Ichthyobacteriaceae bacterium]